VLKRPIDSQFGFDAAHTLVFDEASAVDSPILGNSAAHRSR
jgi:hypothetical protein